MQLAQEGRWKEMAPSRVPPRNPLHRPTNGGQLKSPNPAQLSSLGQLAPDKLYSPNIIQLIYSGQHTQVNLLHTANSSQSI